MVDELFDIDGDGRAVIRLHVQPGAGRTAVVGRHGDALKVRVAAPPEKGRANAACAALLAEALGVAESDIELTSGESSRSKRFAVSGLEEDELRKRLELALTLAGEPAGGSGNASGRSGVHRPSR